ncbi:MAG: uroporphyrinogen-III C-methyltransferase [Anderseniella sp.]|nr:uroporphyrinogen-III C-methyltransferase [Anderseniella sp.]
MRYYPVFLDLEAKTVIIVGGGVEAAQKLRLMAKTPARIVVITPFAERELSTEIDAAGACLISREFDADDLYGASLVFACGLDEADEAAVHAAATERSIRVNVVDRQEKCSFLTPSIVDRGSLTIAIGTEGAAPVLGQGIKAHLEAMLPPSIGALVDKASALRPRVARALDKGSPRRDFWRSFFFGDIRAAFERDPEAGFDQSVDEALSGERGEATGSVSLVGAGPGDADLLTLKAQRRLQDADVIVYDRLVGPGILDYARRDAERIDVGKTPGKPSVSQTRINGILIEQASAGKRVVRLKGGDPYMFGRGGEEQTALVAAGIPVEVVSGITAAVACAAAIRLPLTWRGENRAFTVMTGTAGDGAADHDWAALAKPGTAFSIYMGVRQAGHIQRQLLGAGIAEDTPVVVVENGTRSDQKTAVGTIATLSRTLALGAIKGPAIIYVGLDPARSDVLDAQVRIQAAAEQRIAS